jgi:hypothetical protein
MARQAPQTHQLMIPWYPRKKVSIAQATDFASGLAVAVFVPKHVP